MGLTTRVIGAGERYRTWSGGSVGKGGGGRPSLYLRKGRHGSLGNCFNGTHGKKGGGGGPVEEKEKCMSEMEPALEWREEWRGDGGKGENSARPSISRLTGWSLQGG